MKITDYTGKADASVINFVAERLGVPDGVELVIIHNEKILDRFGNESLHIDAIMHRMDIPGKYQLVVRKRPMDPLRRILIHETIHLAQYESGELSLDTASRTFTWKGVQYGPEIEYKRRPWEIDTFRLTEQLMKEYKKSNHS